MGRYADCFWVSAKITFQQTKPNYASNSVGFDFSALTVQHILDTILNDCNPERISNSCLHKRGLILDLFLSFIDSKSSFQSF